MKCKNLHLAAVCIVLLPPERGDVSSLLSPHNVNKVPFFLPGVQCEEAAAQYRPLHRRQGPQGVCGESVNTTVF